MTPAYEMGESRVGKTVGGKYQLVRLLGKGGMGEVYEAKNIHIGRRFALKFLLPELTRNAEIVSRFQREAHAAGALENENIAAVMDTGVDDDGAPFLVMEYLEGEDLAHLLVSQGRLPVHRAVYILIQACRGLLAAHVKGIVHRDLKPENLFICKRNDGIDLVKVLDFGIAKLHVDTVMTQTGRTMGTPHYISLEQARGARDVDLRTDIYALGVILYEILGGTKPHPGDSYNEVLYHIISKVPEPLDSIRPGLPTGLSNIVHKAMAQEASDRYASTSELMKALIPFAERNVTPIKSLENLPAIGTTLAIPVSLQGIVAVNRFEPTLIEPAGEQDGDQETETPFKRSFGLGKVATILGGLMVVALVMWLVFLRQPGVQPIAETPSTPKTVVPILPIPIPELEQPDPAVAVAEPAAPAPNNKAEAPAARPPGRSPGHRTPRRKGPMTVKKGNEKSAPDVSRSPETWDSLPSPRKNLVRAIDRKNPFAD